MIKTVEELKKLIDDYDEIISKAADIADGYYFHPEYIEYYDDSITVYGTETCCGETYNENYTFPIEWMFMSDEQLIEAKAEKKRQEEIAHQEFLRKQAEKEAQEQEQKDREEYKRLKAKFEGK